MRANVDVSTADRGRAAVDARSSPARRCSSRWSSRWRSPTCTQILPPRYGQGVVRSLPSLFLSVPTFVIGMLLVRVFAFELGLVHASWSRTAAVATLVAAVALGIPVSAQIAEVLVTNVDHEQRAGLRGGRQVARARPRRACSRSTCSSRRRCPCVTVLALTVGELLGGVAHHRVDLRAQRHRQPRAEGGGQPGPARPAGGRVARRRRVRRREPAHRPALPGARRARASRRTRPRRCRRPSRSPADRPTGHAPRARPTCRIRAASGALACADWRRRRCSRSFARDRRRARLGAGPRTWWRRRTRPTGCPPTSSCRRAPRTGSAPTTWAATCSRGWCTARRRRCSARWSRSRSACSSAGWSGCCAGFVGGWVDSALGRLVDVLLADPGLPARGRHRELARLPHHQRGDRDRASPPWRCSPA